MRIILTVPREVLISLLNIDERRLQRRLLESLAIEAYVSDLLTQRQIMDLLAFTTREELWQFFQINKVSFTLTIEDI